MEKTLYIPIDTSIKNTVECTKLVKRGDTLLLLIKVFENAALTNLTGQSVDVILKKSDGTLIEKTVDVADISNGTISVRPGQQSSLVEGVVSGEVQIYTDSTLSSTNTFTYKVDASLADDVLEISQNDIQVLSDLRNLINTGEVTIAKYKDNILAIADSIEAIEALANIKLYIDTNLVDLENANALAVVNIANENIQNDEATQNIIDLTAINNTANTLNGELESNILSGNTLNTDLESNITTGGVLNDDLEANILTAQNKINSLDTENINATNKISELETATTNAETKKQEVIAECEVADDKIAAMNAFGDVTQVSQDITDIKNEINNARGTEANLGARLDEFDTSLSESAKQTDLDAMALYNATCAYASNVFTLTLANAPATLPSYFTVRVKMPSEWVDGSTILIGAKTYNVINAAFMLDEVVIINVDEVAAKCFFKSGGGGSATTETLPQQVDTFYASPSDGVINLTWSNSNTTYLSGYYIVYKQGTTAPTTLNDGIKIDITNVAATSQQITGVTNGSQYTCRIFPYNSKKQIQAEYKVLTVTPTIGLLASSLVVGSKITADGKTFIVVDKNHSGYPSNSVTLMLETGFTGVAYDTNNSSRFSVASIKTYLNGTFLDALTTLKSKIIDTNVMSLLVGGSTESYYVKIFIPTITEATKFANVRDSGLGHSTLAYFNMVNYYSIGSEIHFSRTIDSTRYTVCVGINATTSSDGGSVTGIVPTAINSPIKPIFNISGNTALSLTTNAQGYYTLM